MMMILGFFVFSLPTATYQQLQRKNTWRHAANPRVGAAPAYQFAGRGEETITLDGSIMPEFKGTPLSLDVLRTMADKGAAWPLIAGTGRIYGLYVIEDISETQSYFFNDGAPRKIEFSITLKQTNQPKLLALGLQIGMGILQRGGIMTLLSTTAAVAANTYPTPTYKLVVNGVDISQYVSPRLMSLTINDNRGLEADSIDIELSDHDGQLEIPPKDAIVEVWLGWSNAALVYKGKFTVTELEHAGTPDVLRIRATSADLKKTLKQKKDRSFDNKTIGDIVSTIAAEHGLNPKVADTLATRVLAHIDQNESDANLLTRIADEHDAIATVKNGYLLFMPTGASQSVSGLDLPTKTLTRAQGDTHRYSNTSGGEDISGVTAYYYDVNKAEKQKYTIGLSDSNTRELRHVFRDKFSAEHKAQAEFKRLKRATSTLSYNLAKGDPDCIPEMTYIFENLKAEINAIVWLGTNIVHSLTADGGYTTALTLEVQLPDTDDISQLVDEQGGEYTGIVAYYKLFKNSKAYGKLTKGDQSNPLRLTYLYVSKATAKPAVEREYKMLMAEKAT